MCPPRMKPKDSEKLPLKWFSTKENSEYSRLQTLHIVGTRDAKGQHQNRDF